MSVTLILSSIIIMSNQILLFLYLYSLVTSNIRKLFVINKNFCLPLPYLFNFKSNLFNFYTKYFNFQVKLKMALLNAYKFPRLTNSQVRLGLIYWYINSSHTFALAIFMQRHMSSKSKYKH